MLDWNNFNRQPCHINNFLGLYMDIDEFRLVLDNMATQIWYMKDEETVGYVNNAHASFLGVKKEDIQYKKLFDLVSRKEAEVCIESNRKVLTSKKQINSEEWVRNGNSELRFLSITKTPKYDNNGNVEYIICSADDITEKKRKEEELQKYREHLEKLVQERTEKLEHLNEELKRDIHERKQIESSLKSAKKLLKEKANILEETNIALKVLIKNHEDTYFKIGENIISNVKNFVLPYIDKLKNISNDSDQIIFIDIIEKHLMKIVNPFAKKFTADIAKLSGAEVQISQLIYEDRTAKEIADLLYISENTVKVHKKHIREKLGIKNKQINLKTYLKSIFE